MSIKKSSDDTFNINDLPNELLVEIFKCFTHNELAPLACICKKWRELTRSPVLWLKMNVALSSRYRSQEDSMKAFFKFLPSVPSNTTSLELPLSKNGIWYLSIDFREFCVMVQQKCPALNELILYGGILSNCQPSIVDVCIEYLPNLTSLVISFPEIFEQGTSTSLLTFDITLLDVSGWKLEHFREPLSRMPSLKKLSLCCTDITDSWFESEVTFLSQLEVLHLGYSPVGRETFQAIQIGGSNLIKLYICGMQLSDDDLDIDTSTFPQLETICLGNCKDISHEGVVSLVRSCPSLKNIYVCPDVALAYTRHSFIVANPDKLGIAKSICCNERYHKIYEK